MSNDTQTVTLTEFLLARIAEDEAAARAATPGPWRYNPNKEWHTDEAMLQRARNGLLTYDGEEFVAAGPGDAATCVAATGPTDHHQSMADADHIARHDPARVLAECEAKRRIVEQLERNVRDVPQGWIDRLLQHLAAVYADHPEYHEEWTA